MPTQLQTMQTADQALRHTATAEPLTEHYDAETGEYRRQEHGIVQNLIGEVIEISFRDRKTPEGARANITQWLRDMAAEMHAVADAVDRTP